MLDKIDRKLLALLQQDCTLSLQALAEAVNLTTTPCWKRLKRLEDDGILIGKVALLDPEKNRPRPDRFCADKKRNITAANGIAALSRWLPKCQKCWGSGAWLVNTII